MTARLFSLALTAVLVLALAGPASAETIQVTSLLDRGDGTLRAAIEEANALGNVTIAFDVAGTIEIASALPTLIADGIVIDGCTAPGVVVLVRSAAVSTVFDGLRVEGPGNVVRCLTVRSFLRDGISIVGDQARDDRLELNTVEDAGDDGIGIAYGAEGTALDNVVIGSVNKGILVYDGSTATLVGNTLRSNKDGIAVTAASTATIMANTAENSADNGIAVTSGSTASLEQNLVRANRGIGVWLKDSGTTASLVGNTVDRNSNHGIGVKRGVSAQITGNVISNNTGAGIWMESGADVRLGGNTFVGNTKGDVKIVP